MISNSREKTTILQARVRAEIVTEELQRLIEGSAATFAAADHQHGAEQGAGGAAEARRGR